jgi:mevalonate kinase
MTNSTSAPAKIILFGEHAAVYGHPAIAIPISQLRAHATIQMSDNQHEFTIVAKDLGEQFTLQQSNPLTEIAHLVLKYFGVRPPPAEIHISSDIPQASGLGSGAAVSTALARAVALSIGRTISDDEVNPMIFETEKRHHGTPSGIDNTVIVYEKPIYFIKNKSLEPLEVGAELTWVIANTGIPALTHLSIGDVRNLVETQPDFILPVLESIGKLVTEARSALHHGATQTLGKLMLENHKLLQKLTVSSDQLNTLVDAAMDAGAYGAKLSGGGRGGNMIALVDAKNASTVEKALTSAGAVTALTTTLAATK